MLSESDPLPSVPSGSPPVNSRRPPSDRVLVCLGCSPFSSQPSEMVSPESTVSETSRVSSLFPIVVEAPPSCFLGPS